MQAFKYTANPARVLFGVGTMAALPDEIDRLGLGGLLVVSAPGGVDLGPILAVLGERSAGVFPDAAMHTPVAVTLEAMRMVGATNADGILAIGGGSAIGLSKAIAVRTGLAQIVLPTTYAGSEMTPILGETQDGLKTTRSSPDILPEVVVYDVGLTTTLPVGASVNSGFNAIAHAVEALYAKDRNPVTDLMALEAVSAFSRALPGIAVNPHDLIARSDALYGAWLAGACLGTVGMSIHHKLCHVLGGAYALPHAETHTVLLPHTLAYNAPAIPEVMNRLRQVFGGCDPCLALFEMAGRLGAQRTLADLGMPKDRIEEAVGLALQNPYWNPQPLEPHALRGLITRAWGGARPAFSRH